MPLMTDDNTDGTMAMERPAPIAELPITHIAPTHGWRALHLRDLWAYRELMYLLAWRDIAVRYKQAALGVSWAIVNPVMSMVIYTIIFSKLARFPTENGMPYPVFLFAVMLPWTFFSTAVSRAGASLIANAGLITKVYFPRLIVPLSAIAAGIIDFLISCGILAILMLWFHIAPTWKLLALPGLLLVLALAALAVSLWIAAISVHYRDAQHLLPFLLQIMLYASPIMYSPDMIYNPTVRFLYNFNPLYGLLQSFRWALAHGNPPTPLAIAVTGVTLAILLVSGIYYFTRVETILADVV